METQTIESKLNGRYCPFAEGHNVLHYGVYLLGDEVRYKCILTGGGAKGGQFSKSIPPGATTPCTMKYARRCDAYKNSRG